MVDHAHSTYRRTLLAAPIALTSAPAAAAAHVSGPDERLLLLLAETREAEAAYSDAASLEDTQGEDAASERLDAALAAMADSPAAGWEGAAVKAARLCRSLRDSGGLMVADGPLVASLIADLARLAPAVRA